MVQRLQLARSWAAHQQPSAQRTCRQSAAQRHTNTVSLTDYFGHTSSPHITLEVKRWTDVQCARLDSKFQAAVTSRMLQNKKQRYNAGNDALTLAL
jgi:hypothetical protein